MAITSVAYEIDKITRVNAYGFTIVAHSLSQKITIDGGDIPSRLNLNTDEWEYFYKAVEIMNKELMEK